MKYLAFHPEFLPQYLLRFHKLRELLRVDESLLKKAWSEAKSLSTDMYDGVLAKLHYLGQMDRRKSQLLYMVIRVVKPEVVVETGVGAGVGTTYILVALERNNHGRLISIDAELGNFGLCLPQGKEIGWLVPARFRHRWRLVIGLSSNILEPLLKELGDIECFFHDSEHSYQNMSFEFEMSYQYLRPTGLILSDNIEWNKAFQDFCKKHDLKRTMLFGFGLAVK